MTRLALSRVFALLSGAGTVSAQAPTIHNIGVLPGGAVSIARGVGGNGVVVGSCLQFGVNRAVMWTKSAGLVELGVLPGGTFAEANSASATGGVVVGMARNTSNVPRAFRAAGAPPIVDMGTLPGTTTASARDISADGLVVVGDSGFRAFRWTSAGGMVDLGLLPGGLTSIAYGVNSDGSVVVGGSSSSGGQAFRWTEATGMVGLGTLPGGTASGAFAVSGDGAVVVGESRQPDGPHGFRWTQATGMQDLGLNVNLLGAGGDTAAGSMRVGVFLHAAMWTPETGLVDLNTYLASRGTNLSGWEVLSQAYAVSDDGSVIVGVGTSGGVARGWVVNLDPDTDGDGLRDSWEILGVPYKDAAGVTHRLELPGADPMRKNLYVEVDLMSGFFLHPEAIAMVEGAFADSPVPNPQGPDGIALHIAVDDRDLPPLFFWPTNGCWPLDFDGWRTAFYGTAAERADPAAGALLRAKAKAYRYCIIADRASPDRVAGCGQQPGDNFVVFAHGIDRVHDRMASCFMHELGHNLGLGHGGGDDINGKPNYPSVMNYVLAFKYRWSRAFWRLDYSRAGAPQLMNLNELSLDERFGIGPETGPYSRYYMPFGFNADLGGTVVRDYDYVCLNNGRVDYGNTAGTGLRDGFFNSGVRQDLNYVADTPGTALPSTPSPGQTLVAFNDWANISLPLSTVRGAGAPAPRFPTDELTEEAIAWIDQNFRDPPSPCYADCDTSSGPGVLDIFDFLCFQNRFDNGEPYACDCDTTGGPLVCDIFDFLCFQNAYDAGCP